MKKKAEIQKCLSYKQKDYFPIKEVVFRLAAMYRKCLKISNSSNEAGCSALCSNR